MRNTMISASISMPMDEHINQVERRRNRTSEKIKPNPRVMYVEQWVGTTDISPKSISPATDVTPAT